MRIAYLLTRLPGALALSVVAGTVLAPVAGDEPDALIAIVASECLVPQSELDKVSLTIIDEKLALSLAVETHIQIELAQFALAGIRHDGLTHFTEKKLRNYQQIFNTLEVLTGGRVGKVLSRATRKSATVAATSHATPTIAPAVINLSRATSGRKGGIGSVVEIATASAVLHIRLAIAQEYAQLLRTELGMALPEEFDRRYLSVESVNQMQVLAMLRVFEQQASPGFARVIHLATVAAEAHASEIRQAIEQFESPPPPVIPEKVVSTALEKS